MYLVRVVIQLAGGDPKLGLLVPVLSLRCLYLCIKEKLTNKISILVITSEQFIPVLTYSDLWHPTRRYYKDMITTQLGIELMVLNSYLGNFYQLVHEPTWLCKVKKNSGFNPQTSKTKQLVIYIHIILFALFGKFVTNDTKLKPLKGKCI
jgi:hypothetical protein